MDPEYGARYRRLYRHHWWWRAREERIVAELERLARGRPGGFGAILDVGCGDALFFPRLRRFGEPRGVEVDGALVSAETRESGAVHLGPFDDSYHPGRRFGLILMLDVIEHLDDDVAALRRAAELLDPGGVLVVTVPASPALWTAHDDYNHHRRRYTPRTLTAAARAAGLAVHRRRHLFHWLAPLKILVRAREALLPAELRMPEVPPPFWNRLFYAVSRLEQATWGRLPWPFGSSLLMVCERSPHPGV
jgi:SAM-dependent methyltransferase